MYDCGIETEFWKTVRVVYIGGEYFVFQEKVEVRGVKKSRNSKNMELYKEVVDHRLWPMFALIDEEKLAQYLGMDDQIDDMKEV